MVTVQNVVLSTPQLSAQGADELSLSSPGEPANGSRGRRALAPSRPSLPAARGCNRRSNRLLFVVYAHARASGGANFPLRRGRGFRLCEGLALATSKCPRVRSARKTAVSAHLLYTFAKVKLRCLPPGTLNLAIPLQEYRAVLHLIPDLGVLVEIANSTASRGGQLFSRACFRTLSRHKGEVRTQTSAPLARICFAPFKIRISAPADFDAMRNRQMMLRKIAIESDCRYPDFFGFVCG